MTNKLRVLAAGLAGAAVPLGAAVAGPLEPAPSSEVARTVATPVSATSQGRVYCYSGLTGTPDHLSRGWVCQRETGPARR